MLDGAGVTAMAKPTIKLDTDDCGFSDRELKEQLHPHRITGASDQMYFIISTILGAGWVEHPRAYGGFSITSDGFVTSGGLFLGGVDDFERNVKGYVAAAELPKHIENRFWDRYARIVSDWRPAGGAWRFEVVSSSGGG